MKPQEFSIVQLNTSHQNEVKQLARDANFVKKATWTKSAEAMMAGELVTGERKAIAIMDRSGQIVAYLDYKIKGRGAIGIGFCVTLESYRGLGFMNILLSHLIENYSDREMTVSTSENNSSMLRVIGKHDFVLVLRKQDREDGEHSLYYRRCETVTNETEDIIVEASSGPDWVKLFPTSVSTHDLIPSFRKSVEGFLDALRQAGTSVRINATYRPPERAYLMHYAYRIAREGLDPVTIRSFWGLPIRWLHLDSEGDPDLPASVQAAEKMVRAYGIAYAPAMYSTHTEGRAIDMTITWDGDLHILNATGQLVNITSEPRNGADNSVLHTVGASYKVIKMVGDAPHWSDDGY